MIELPTADEVAWPTPPLADAPEKLVVAETLPVLFWSMNIETSEPKFDSKAELPTELEPDMAKPSKLSKLTTEIDETLPLLFCEPLI